MKKTYKTKVLVSLIAAAIVLVGTVAAINMTKQPEVTRAVPFNNGTEAVSKDVTVGETEKAETDSTLPSTENATVADSTQAESAAISVERATAACSQPVAVGRKSKVAFATSEPATRRPETTSERVTEKVTEPATGTTSQTPVTTEATTEAVRTLFDCGTLDGGYSATGFERKVFDGINAERAKAGLAQLKWNDNIHTLCRIRSDEQSALKGHTRPDGRKMSSVFKDEGGIRYTHVGEIIGINIPVSDEGVELVVGMWMNSDSHRAAILNPNYEFGGLAATEGGDGYANVVALFYNYKY